MLRRLGLAAALAAAATSPALAVVKDDAPSSAPLEFSDGARAVTFDHCGDADKCATISYPGGDVLAIYSQGAAFCQPYNLRFVRSHGLVTLFEYSFELNRTTPASGGLGVPFGGSRCGNNAATQMTLDRGNVHLTVDEYTDGSLRFIFDPATPPGRKVVK